MENQMENNMEHNIEDRVCGDMRQTCLPGHLEYAV